MITSPDNEQLKTIRKLGRKRDRDRSGLFVAEGEDLIAAAAEAGWEPVTLLHAGSDVEPDLLARVSALGSGSRVVGVYRQRWGEPGGRVSVYLHGVRDPGNLGTVIRAAHALADGPVVLGPGCADPWGPKAVRASMGSIFARPPVRGDLGDLPGARLALTAEAKRSLAEAAAQARPPVVVCVGAERQGLPAEIAAQADLTAAIPLRPGGPESLNAALATTLALYELDNRMAANA